MTVCLRLFVVVKAAVLWGRWRCGVFAAYCSCAPPGQNEGKCRQEIVENVMSKSSPKGYVRNSRRGKTIVKWTWSEVSTR